MTKELKDGSSHKDMETGASKMLYSDLRHHAAGNAPAFQSFTVVLQTADTWNSVKPCHLVLLAHINMTLTFCKA